MGDHPLFCVCPFRGGIGRGMPSCAGGADPYYVETISLHTDADPHHEDFISLIYDCARQGHTSPIVASFLPSPPKEETKQRRKGAARSLRPGSLAGRYLRLTRSLRSLRQAKRAGKLHQFLAWGAHSLNVHPLWFRIGSLRCKPTYGEKGFSSYVGPLCC